ncbi:Hydroxymethylpyrimidine/phosphomethylpyrimidine kinase [compost metagenome]
MQETKHTFPTVLTIAGFDGSGGAGIQADIKTISALGGYATSVLTALPVQNTMGVKQVYPIPSAIVAAQLETVLEDIRPYAIKIGMLHTTAHIEAICAVLSRYPDIPVILDPVMISSSGKRLLDASAIATMQSLLFPHIALLTPNMDEAAILAGISVQSVSDMERAGAIILQQGCPAVLVKGGHMEGEVLQAIYVTVEGEQHIFTQPRVDSTNTHGTGCTLSAAMATFLAKGYTMTKAIEAAQEYVHKAILASQGVHIGSGKGSLNHFFDPKVMHTINK